MQLDGGIESENATQMVGYLENATRDGWCIGEDATHHVVGDATRGISGNATQMCVVFFSRRMQLLVCRGCNPIVFS